MNDARRIMMTILMLATLVGTTAVAGGSPGETVDRYFDAYRSGSLEGMLSSYSAEAVFEDVNQRHTVTGPEQIGQLLGTLVAMHLEMGLKEKRRAVSGGTVVVEFDYVGTLNGHALGQAIGKTGCPDLQYVLPATSWYEIKDGKIVHQRDYIDLATYKELQQQMMAAGSGD